MEKKSHQYGVLDQDASEPFTANTVNGLVSETAELVAQTIELVSKRLELGVVSLTSGSPAPVLLWPGAARARESIDARATLWRAPLPKGSPRAELSAVEDVLTRSGA